MRLTQGTELQTREAPCIPPTGDKPLLDVTSDTCSATEVSIWPALPSQPRATELLDLYFDICVATYKPLHRPTVDEWYSIVAENLALGRPRTWGLSNAKVATLLAIFAVANFHHQKSLGAPSDTASLVESDSFFRCSTALTDAESEISQLESAQARLLQVFYLLATCRMNRAWYIFGNLLQTVSALGMHRRNRRKRSTPFGTTKYIQIQCHIRTFWCTYILDRYLGVLFGRPRHFQDDDIDQDYPDRIDDDAPQTTDISESVDNSECHLDGFLWNIKLAQILGDISHSLYKIRPLPETSRIQLAHKLAERLQDWQASLPALLKAKPTSLARGFRRQNVALRMAYQHAVMHLYRPFLLRRITGPLNSFHAESVSHCISAAQEVMRYVDKIAQDGLIFHAFWWTHYIAFCALAVTHVCHMQSAKAFDEASGRQELLALADRCQNHLAMATASNSPSRRYSVIVQELRRTVNHQRGSDTSFTAPTDDPSMISANISGQLNESGNSSSITYPATSIGSAFDANTIDGLYSPFTDWQTSDWLDLDASVSMSPKSRSYLSRSLTSRSQAYWEFYDFGHDSI